MEAMMMDAYAAKAGELQEETDMMLEVPKGNFSQTALNAVVDAFNDALEAMGFEGDYPEFTDDQNSLPIEFVRGLAMMSDAAAESESGVDIDLAGVRSDNDLALLASKLKQLADSPKFKAMMADDGEEPTTEVDITVASAPEDLMMERA